MTQTFDDKFSCTSYYVILISKQLVKMYNTESLFYANKQIKLIIKISARVRRNWNSLFIIFQHQKVLAWKRFSKLNILHKFDIKCD